MIPYDMIIEHDIANGKWGDCFRCCIASLLELDPRDVPHFMEEGESSKDKWYPRLLSWLTPQGLTYFEFNCTEEALHTWQEFFTRENVNVYHTLSGQSPIAKHTVIAYNGKCVFDPSPSKAGLVGPFTDDNTYSIGFIIKACR